MSEGVAKPPPGRTPATDELLRRVGRNLVIFQQIEHVLKGLIAHATFQAPVSEIAEYLAKRRESVAKVTMGELAGKLSATILAQDANDAAADAVPDEIDEVWLRFQFRVESDAESIQQLDANLKDLVARRNELVHHFLPRWQFATEDDAAGTLVWLDAQRDAAIGMLDRLQGWARTFATAATDHVALLKADVRRLDAQVLLRSSRLVEMLGQVAMATPRPDGWTLLASAGHLIKRAAPEELEKLGERFGYATLKAVLLATELFDVTEEPTPGGGSRTIYRINERWRLESPPGDSTVGSSSA